MPTEADDPSDRKKPKRALPKDFASLTPKLLAHGKSKAWPEWWVLNRLESFVTLAERDDWRYSNWLRAAQNFLGNEIGYRRGPIEMAHLRPRIGSKALSEADIAARKQANEAALVRQTRESLAGQTGSISVDAAKLVLSGKTGGLFG